MAKGRVWFGNRTAAAAAITGTLAATETGADVAAATGDVLVQGTLAATESGSDTCAATGRVLVQGVLAAVETGQDGASGEGTAPSARVTSHVGAKKYRPRFVPSPVFDEAPVVEVSGRFTQPRQITSGDVEIANPVVFHSATVQQRHEISGEVSVDMAPIIRRRKIQLAALLAA